MHRARIKETNATVYANEGEKFKCSTGGLLKLTRHACHGKHTKAKTIIARILPNGNEFSEAQSIADILTDKLHKTTCFLYLFINGPWDKWQRRKC